MGLEMVNTAQVIAGKQDDMFIESVSFEDSPESLDERVTELLNSVAESGNILFFVDMKGGTPWNTVMKNSGRRNSICLAGVNLPMLLEAIIKRSNGGSISDIAEAALKTGKAAIVRKDF